MKSIVVRNSLVLLALLMLAFRILGISTTAFAKPLIGNTDFSVINTQPIDSNPTNMTEVQFSVEFSEPVQNVDATDFTPVSLNITGQSILGVTGSSGDTTYIVTVSTGTGDGELSLDVSTDPTGNIANMDGDPLLTPFNGLLAYTIDKTDPGITIDNPNTDPATSKTITASSPDDTLVAMSNTTGSTCDASLSFIAYSSQIFPSESDNGTKVCYKAVDAAGNDSYELSNAIAGIDTTGPDITINEPDTSPAQSKTITASVLEGTLIGMSNIPNSTCDASLTFIAYSSQIFSSESDNSTKVCYKAVDALGNDNYEPSNAIAGIDKTGPEIIINNPDTSPAQSKTITASVLEGTLIGMSNIPDSTCDASLTFIAYSSQVFPSESDNGTKVCYKAVDALGNDNYEPSNAIAGIDTTGPDITINEPDTSPAQSKTITASVSEGTLIGMSNIPDSTCDASLTFITYSSQIFSSESDNDTKVCYKAVDAAGNDNYEPSNAIAGIDKTGPNITINEPDTSPALSKTITASVSEGTLVAMSNTTGTTCNGTLIFIPYDSQPFFDDSKNGTRVCYKAVDALGNTNYRLSNPIAGIDTTAPLVNTFVLKPSQGTTVNIRFFGASDDGGSGIAGYLITESADVPSVSNPNWQIPSISKYKAKSLKSKLYPWVKDNMGHVSSAIAPSSLIIDKTPPTKPKITVKPGIYTNQTSVHFEFTSTDKKTSPKDLTFRCSIDGKRWEDCDDSYTKDKLTARDHYIYIYAIDEAGNNNWPGASYAWAVDVTKPNTVITAKPNKTTTSRSASFSYTGTDNRSGVAKFECKLITGATDPNPGSGYTPCQKSYLGLDLGTHTFYVRAVDRAGNTENTPASYTWNITKTAKENGWVNVYSITSKISILQAAAFFPKTDREYVANKKDGSAPIKMAGVANTEKRLLKPCL